MLLSPQQIHIWGLWLEAADPMVLAYRRLLSEDEERRASRFIVDYARRSFELSQGALRILASRYLDCRPTDVSLDAGSNGKPLVRDQPAFHFNKAHSGQLAIYAFAREGQVGIDIEHLQQAFPVDSVAGYFNAAELSELHSIPDQTERSNAFFRCWTRKEAYIKAIGSGLQTPLDRFQVTLLPHDPPRIVKIEDDVAKAAAWNLHHLDPAPGYVGALAYQGSLKEIVSFQLLRPDELLNQN